MPRRSPPYALTPRARADLEDIWLYTSKRWSVAQADVYYAQLISAFEKLAAGSLKGRSAEAVRAGYLKHHVGSHVVYHRFVDGMLAVMRVLHQSMDAGRHV